MALQRQEHHLPTLPDHGARSRQTRFRLESDAAFRSQDQAPSGDSHLGPVHIPRLPPPACHEDSAPENGAVLSYGKPAVPSTITVGIVAIVGCDGSGKSTLTADILARLQQRGPIERRYLGLASGEVSRRIKKLPIVGAALERYVVGKAAQAQDRSREFPGAATAVVIYLLSLYRAMQFRRMLIRSRRGVLVITDRFPQTEIPGIYCDGPALSVVAPGSWLIPKLAAAERRLYQWMVNHVPELVIRLNIDAESAHRRKPDHRLALLRETAAVTPVLRFNGARIVDIDALAPYPQVLGAALQALDATVAARSKSHVFDTA